MFKVICDDFYDDTYVGESWSANVSSLWDLSGSLFGNVTDSATKYNEVGWLATQLFGASTASDAANIQFALWQVFDDGSQTNGFSPFSLLAGTTNLAAAQSWLTQAQTSRRRSRRGIFQHDAIPPTACISGPCSDGSRPQEFVGIKSVPEPGTLLLFGTGLAGLFFPAASRRRRPQFWHKIRRAAYPRAAEDLTTGSGPFLSAKRQTTTPISTGSLKPAKRL